MKWSQTTEIGLVRKHNEDAICIIPDLAFFAIADGMGGHRAGEVASKMALSSLAKQLQEAKGNDVARGLLEGVHKANLDIYHSSKQEGANRGMGTTLTAAIITEKDLTLAHVGDSRAYLIRGDTIRLLTEDHSLVQEMIRHGGITKEQARAHPQRNVLTRALGVNSSVDIDLNRFKLESGDRLVLCTDGLYGLVGDRAILELTLAASGPEQAVRDLAEEALQAGGKDNISVIVVEMDD